MTRTSGKGPVHRAPPDFKQAIEGREQVQIAWKALTPLARNEWICWVTSAKKSETRAKRIGRALEDLSLMVGLGLNGIQCQEVADERR